MLTTCARSCVCACVRVLRRCHRPSAGEAGAPGSWLLRPCSFGGNPSHLPAYKVKHLYVTSFHHWRAVLYCAVLNGAKSQPSFVQEGTSGLGLLCGIMNRNAPTLCPLLHVYIYNVLTDNFRLWLCWIKCFFLLFFIWWWTFKLHFKWYEQSRTYKPGLNCQIFIATVKNVCIAFFDPFRVLMSYKI